MTFADTGPRGPLPRPQTFLLSHMIYTTPISSHLRTRRRELAFESRCMCEMGFNTAICCCRPQKGARRAASSHAQLPALPFELIEKLPLRVRASRAWALTSRSRRKCHRQQLGNKIVPKRSISMSKYATGFGEVGDGADSAAVRKRLADASFHLKRRLGGLA
jgi:hypothetical protein